MTRLRSLSLLISAIVLALGAGPFAARSSAALKDDGNASWRLEQPSPPLPPVGVPASSTPVGLGKIGDIEFWAPNRGLLITAGNGSTIPPGLWAYNGEGWHELSTVCGATDGRIAWAGPEEFWTISDGRPGQALGPEGQTPPLQDDTLCHFAEGKVLSSYASPAFQASSYEPMHAAGCIPTPGSANSSDCWFAGDALPPELPPGAFHLHWNGVALTAEPNAQGHVVKDMRLFEKHLYESVQLSPADRAPEPDPEVLQSSAIHRINALGVTPVFSPIFGLPLYGPGEFPTALGYLHLSAGENALWGAADPVPEGEVPKGSTSGEVTIVRYSQGVWSQVLGAESKPPAGSLPRGEGEEGEEAEDAVDSVGVEPNAEAGGEESAWLALDSKIDARQPAPGVPAIVARTSAQGVISAEDEQQLPSPEEVERGVGPKGAAEKIVCPAPHECWLATSQGWLFHLSDGTPLPRDTTPAFAGPITYRPPDEGLPQVIPDAPPPDDSGLPETQVVGGSFAELTTPPAEATIAVPLVSNLHSRIVHGSTLQLSFHLAVKARVGLLAKRRKQVVGRVSTRVLAAGNRRLLLRLDPRRWPTKLDLQTHALAPLPRVSERKAPINNNTVTTTSAQFINTLMHPQPGLPF